MPLSNGTGKSEGAALCGHKSCYHMTRGSMYLDELFIDLFIKYVFIKQD